ATGGPRPDRVRPRDPAQERRPRGGAGQGVPALPPRPPLVEPRRGRLRVPQRSRAAGNDRLWARALPGGALGAVWPRQFPAQPGAGAGGFARWIRCRLPGLALGLGRPRRTPARTDAALWPDRLPGAQAHRQSRASVGLAAPGQTQLRPDILIAHADRAFGMTRRGGGIAPQRRPFAVPTSSPLHAPCDGAACRPVRGWAAWSALRESRTRGDGRRTTPATGRSRRRRSAGRARPAPDGWLPGCCGWRG